jgi:hypothetical protein
MNRYIDVRLIDIFLTGPFRIYLSYYVENKFSSYYLFYGGLCVLLFNLFTYLYINLNLTCLETPFKFINEYSDKNKGKPQLHRLYNLFVMYPIEIFILSTSNLSVLQKMLYLLLIVSGFIYNFKNYLLY